MGGWGGEEEKQWKKEEEGRRERGDHKGTRDTQTERQVQKTYVVQSTETSFSFCCKS